MKLFKISLCLSILLCAACSAEQQSKIAVKDPGPGAAVEVTEVVAATHPPAASPETQRPEETPTPISNLAASYPGRPACIADQAVFETGQVIRIIDGDTIEVFMDGQAYPVRYIGIDSPEIQHPQKGQEIFGPEAAALNRALVQGRQVMLVRDLSDRDGFGRLLRYIFLDSLEGTFVNAEIARAGFAQARRYPPDTACAKLLKEAEDEARAAGLGIWSPLVAAAATLDAYATRDASAVRGDSVAIGVSGAVPSSTAPQATQAGDGSIAGVEITTIFYNGTAGDKEPDEYVEIRNSASAAIQLGGWALEDKTHHRFVFPEFEFAAGQVCRIYTNQDHSEWCGFNFQYSDTAIWNNGGDCAILTDSQGRVAVEYCYKPGQ